MIMKLSISKTSYKSDIFDYGKKVSIEITRMEKNPPYIEYATVTLKKQTLFFLWVHRDELLIKIHALKSLGTAQKSN